MWSNDNIKTFHFDRFILDFSKISFVGFFFYLYVSTAAHCITKSGDSLGKRTSNLRILVGSNNLIGFTEKNSQLYTPSRIIVHQDWNPLFPNYGVEAALLIVQNKIKFTPFVQPICLFRSMEDTANFQEGWFVGWGGKSSFISPSISYPRKVKLPILNSNVCLSQEPRYFDQMSPRTFCAGSVSISGVCQNVIGNGFFGIS